jgi:ubiquinone/menaquinone biosynthesis C-methylase UbiE
MEVAWIRRHLSGAAADVLDIGCGNGSLLASIDSDRRFGIDHEPAGLLHTRARLTGVPLLAADAGRLPLADASLDAILAQHVIEHVPVCQDACRQWFRVLRPGGVLLVVTPNCSFCDPTVFADETHVQVFDRHRLQHVLTKAGFEVVELRTLGLPWFRGLPPGAGAWRLRRAVTNFAGLLSRIPFLRWQGQSLCCAARRPRA